MSYRTFKRLLLIVTACALTLAMGTQALADQVYVKSSASVYANVGDSKPAGTLKSGTKVELVAEKNGWAMIQKDGHTGYIKASALLKVESVGNVTAYTASDTAMYKHFDGSGKIGTIPAGSAVVVTAKAEGVSYVSYGGSQGFVKSSSLTASAPSQAAATPAPASEEQPQAANATAYVNKDGAKVYNIKGEQIGTLGINTQVTVTATKGDIAQVQSEGKTGYMYKSDLSSEKVAVEATATPAPETTPAPSPEVTPAPTEEVQTGSATAYVNKDGAKVYNGKGKFIGTLGVNTRVTVTAVKGEICQVKSDGRTAYMYKADLSSAPVAVETTPTPEPTAVPGDVETVNATAYVNKDGANLYNDKGEVISTLALDTEVTVVAVKGDICQVNVKGQTAYMKLEDLSKTSTGSHVVNIRETTAYVASEGAKVYDVEGNEIATLPINTEVKVVAYNDKLVKIVVGDGYGYMNRSDVSSSKLDATTYKLKIGDNGEAVKRVQERLKELGYYSGSCDGDFGEATKDAVAAFQSVMKMTGDGIVDGATLEALFAENAPKNPKTDNTDNADTSTGPVGDSTVAPAVGIALEMDWFESDIQTIFARGVTAKFTDVETGLAWREQRRGGWNHADIQPVSAADTAALKKACGGTWSWKRRAVFVTIDGKNYAASINGMPHGSGSISGNNFDGHHCCHFTNSRTHGSDKVDEQHQNMIKKAASTRLG